MKFYKIFLLILVANSWLEIIYSQVLITPTAIDHPFFKLDQLLNIRLVNAGNNPVRGVVQISIEDRSSKAILQMQSLPLSLKANQNYNSHQIKWEQGIDFSNQAVARLLSQSGHLAGGQYVYCYRFIDLEDSRSLGSYCQESNWQNFQRPQLAYPYHEANISTRFPTLSWHPPLPLVGKSLNYSLYLVEIEEGQTLLDALYQNVPLVESHHLNRLFLNYPTTAIPLKEGKRYAWQVTAYWNYIEMGKTDIWEFEVETPVINEEEQRKESFRFVKRQLEGANYLFRDKLFFAYDNRSFDKQLNYKIYIKNGVSNMVKNLPSIDLKPGINKITIPIAKGVKLKKGEQYILEIKNKDGVFSYLEFEISKNK